MARAVFTDTQCNARKQKEGVGFKRTHGQFFVSPDKEC